MSDYKVKDIKLAEFGRKEISLAETESPHFAAEFLYASETDGAGAKSVPTTSNTTVSTPVKRSCGRLDRIATVMMNSDEFTIK